MSSLLGDIRKLSVSQFRSEPLDLDFVIQPDVFDFDSDDAAFKEALSLNTSIQLVDGEVFVTGNLSGVQIFSCTRCLDQCEEKYVKDCVFTIEHKNQKYIDLVPFLREEILLDKPISFLCKDDCRGLCQACGVNKNEVSCHCN